jgi:hypothetical protein
MTTRKNRQTGTMITVYREGRDWFTICEDHAEAVQHETAALARSWAAEPAVWCSQCQPKHEGE